jgi:hypothetical protein
MPDIFERKLWFTDTHAEAEQRGLRAECCILRAIYWEALL